MPILVKSSIALGALPSAVGTVSWLPGPAVAKILLDAAFSPGKLVEPAMNVVHPRPVAWDFVMSNINESLVQEGILQRPLPLISFSKWFDRLQAVDASADNINDIVGINLWLKYYADDVSSTSLPSNSLSSSAISFEEMNGCDPRIWAVPNQDGCPTNSSRKVRHIWTPRLLLLLLLGRGTLRAHGLAT